MAAALGAVLGREPQSVRLIGSAPTLDGLAEGLRKLGHRVECVEWSYRNPLPTTGLGEGILCEVPKGFDDWAICASITADGKIKPLWRLILPWSLFRELFSVYEFNARKIEDVFEVYRGGSDSDIGHRSSGRLARVEQFLPLRGKTIIEFGPSDGNQSADLIALQPAHLLAVEGRPENVIKLLVAKWAMGWKNFDVLLDNFQTPGPWATRRYDFVYAQGVYYHCQNPLVFLETLVGLGDFVFIGGWVASDRKPDTPWVMLEHRGGKYHGKAYIESYHFLSGLAAQSFMLERSEIERFLGERGFSICYCDSTFAENELGTEFIELLAKRDSRG